MDFEDEEIIKLWKIFHEHDVKYILVGGFAVSLHGHSRLTADVDIWIKDSPDNRKKLFAALEEIGLELPESFESIDFIPGWSTIYIPSGVELDIMSWMKGLPQEKFDDCFSISMIAEIHQVPVRFLHLNHLLEAKRASARPQDLLDVAELERLYKLK